jgi:hypothetical protein
MFRRARTSSRRARIRLRKNTSSGADGEPRHHSKVLDAAAYGGEEENLNKLLLTTAMAAMISTGAMAQSTVVTTTGTAHAVAVQQALVAGADERCAPALVAIARRRHRLGGSTP